MHNMLTELQLVEKFMAENGYEIPGLSVEQYEMYINNLKGTMEFATYRAIYAAKKLLEISKLTFNEN